MSPTPIMIAIFFAPKERASVSARSVAWVVLLACCMIVCWGKPSVIPFPYRVLWLDQSVTCLSLLGQ